MSVVINGKAYVVKSNVLGGAWHSLRCINGPQAQIENYVYKTILQLIISINYKLTLQVKINVTEFC